MVIVSEANIKFKKKKNVYTTLIYNFELLLISHKLGNLNVQ
jgi:hypothetical protein